jgi:transcriptional regulator with XRE-family HTH domain
MSDFDGSDSSWRHSTVTYDGAQLTLNGRGGALKNLTPEELIDRRQYLLERRQAIRAAKSAQRGKWIEAQRRDYLERCSAYTLFDLTKHRKCVAAAFGRWMRRRRNDVGLSQEEVAAIIGMDRTYPSLLERGLRCPTVGVANSIAIALRVPPIVFQSEFQEALRDEVKAYKLLEKRLQKMNAKADAKAKVTHERRPPRKPSLHAD